MTIIRNLLVVAGAGIFLAGCGVGDIENMTVKGSSFHKGLYNGYLSLARAEYDETDWKDGGAFSERAVASAGGNAPAPEAIAARKLPKRTVGELTSARGRLVSALDRGAAGKDPANAALAQVMFDCWMQEQEEDLQPGDIAKCRAEFGKAMARVDSALGKQVVAKARPKRKARKPQTTKYVVYFDFNSAALTKNAKTVIDIAKSDAKKGAKVSLAGFTDRAGSSDYNSILSTKRTKAVTAALIKAGVRNNIGTGAFGETQNAVVTKDGVRELLNRRVEILITR